MVACSLLVAGTAGAQDLGHAEEAEHAHPNEVGLIVAGTYEAADAHNLFTLGVEYQRRITDRISVAGAFEYLPSADAWIVVFPATFRIAGGLKAFAGPGLEILSRRAPEGGQETRNSSGGQQAENLFLVRVGVGYHFPLGGRLSLVPNVSFDFVNDEHGWTEAVVYAVNFAIGF